MMMPMHIRRTPGGALNLTLDPPYESFGWFLSAEQDKERLRELLGAIDDLSQGSGTEIRIEHSDSELVVDCTTRLATVKAPNYVAETEPEMQKGVSESMELPLFRELVVEWLKFVKSQGACTGPDRQRGQTNGTDKRDAAH